MEETVVDINRSGVFSTDEAKRLVPTLRAITEKYVQDVENKMLQLESLGCSKNDLVTEIEDEINLKIQAWHSKVRKLGGEPKGLWLVDLDSGHGCYCWKYPEVSLAFWHTYSQGFKGRIPIAEMPPPPPSDVICNSSIPRPENVVSTPL